MAVASTQQAHTYRPDIDGLRAVAVVAVILFHLGSETLGGGFVGVDVFLVISGYLITGFVRREIASPQGFHFLAFFARRVRRLAPALLFVSFVSLGVACFLLLPRQLATFAKSLVSQPIAFQNMHFLAEGQYFEGGELKPLLHTWSLGVEEQFYLVWPFVILFVSRFRRGVVLGLLAGILLLSFGLNLALPLLSPKASFFLFPARAWELGIGGVLAILEEGRGAPSSPPDWRRSAAAGLSLLGLGLSFVWISGEMAFPGWVALLPVAATTALIALSSLGDSPVKRALAARPVVFVGLISYSLYLWHWPVIVFARILGIDPARGLPALGIVAVSVLLAIFSYRYVEQPIRQRRLLPATPRLLGWAAASGAGLMALGLLGVSSEGFALRYGEPARSMLTASFDASGDSRCGIAFRMLRPRAPVCRVNAAPEAPGRGVLLWGNSHAAMWVGLLSELGDGSDTPVYLNARNCRPTTDSPFCDAAVQREVLAFVEARGIRHVLLASSWYGGYGVSDTDLEAALSALVAELAERDVATWLLVDVPADPALDPEARYLLAPEAPSFGSISLAEHRSQQQARESDFFQGLARRHPRVRVIDPTDDFCFDGVRCYGGRGDRAWYRDERHITNTGARQARHRFLPIFPGTP